MTRANEPFQTEAYEPDSELDAGLAAAFRAVPRRSGEPRSISSRISAATGMPPVHLRDPDEDWVTPVNLPASGAMPAPTEVPERYQLLGEIARGGMGTILKGRDIDLGRDIAVKVLLEEHAGKPELLHRFVEEAQISGQLQHPGIVPVYELGQLADQRPFFTMKLVKGQTLAALLESRSGPADELTRWVGIFSQVCQTLAYAHARRVIHRDLKPSNVMVGAFGEVQVMDWGLAKVLAEGGIADEKKTRIREDLSVIRTSRSEGSEVEGSTGSNTVAGSVLGTPAYMAPEQARGDVDLVDERTDVFGLGAVLCEILTGHPPFAGKKAEAQRRAETAQLGSAYERLDASAADPELIGLAKRCLAAEPWDRPRDAGQVAEAVTEYQHSVAERLHQAELAHAAEAARAEEARVTAVEAQAKARAERKSRHLTLALGACVLLAGLVGAAGWRWVELDRMGRVAAREARVHSALQEALRLRGVAQGADEGNLTPWAEAVAAAKNAEALLEPSVNLALQAQARELLAHVTAEEIQAEEAVRATERDRVLLDRLFDIRSSRAELSDFRTPVNTDYASRMTDKAYAKAFREAGLDLEVLTPKDAGERLRSRPAAVDLAAAIDDWAFLRSLLKDVAGAKLLTDLAQAADPDPWRRELRKAIALPNGASQLEALMTLANRPGLETLGPVSIDLLGQALLRAGDKQLAEVVLRKAQQRHPGDVWVNFDLAQLLEQQGKRQDAIRYYMAARAIRPETAHKLAHLLRDAGELDEAVVIFKQLSRLRPKEVRHVMCLARILNQAGRRAEASALLDTRVADLLQKDELLRNDAGHQLQLGTALRMQGKLDEAIIALKESVRIKPDGSAAYTELGQALAAHEDPNAAIAAFRKSIELKPTPPQSAYASLGTLLTREGRIDEALAVRRQHIQLVPNGTNPQNGLGWILCDYKHDYKGAEAIFRKCIELAPEGGTFYCNLGEALVHQGRLEEGIAAMREGVRLSPDRAGFHLNLGGALLKRGLFAEALESFKRGHELGSRQPNWDMPSAEMIRETELMIVLAPNFQSLVEGKTQPADAAQRFALATMCANRQLFGAAVRFFSEGLAADPARGGDLKEEHRSEAARWACLAGTGKALDNPPPDDAIRAKLRQQARTWMAMDLAAFTKLLEGTDVKGPRLVRTKLESLKFHPHLAGLRDAEALKILPAEEQEACRKLWADVDGLLKEAAKK